MIIVNGRPKMCVSCRDDLLRARDRRRRRRFECVRAHAVRQEHYRRSRPYHRFPVVLRNIVRLYDITFGAR